MSISVC